MTSNRNGMTLSSTGVAACSDLALIEQILSPPTLSTSLKDEVLEEDTLKDIGDAAGKLKLRWARQNTSTRQSSARIHFARCADFVMPQPQRKVRAFYAHAAETPSIAV
jgi:hypothetical protein